MIDVNLTGVFLCGKYAIRQMRKQGGGVIVNSGSVYPSFGMENLTV